MSSITKDDLREIKKNAQHILNYAVVRENKYIERYAQNIVNKLTVNSK